MITFKIKTGIDGYNMTSALREEYLNTGAADEHDADAIHIAGYENGKVICVGRMYTTGSIRCVIDNVIVDNDNRMQYVGDTVMRALEDKAVQIMRAFIDVQPTENSRAFFKAEGYVGDDKMSKDLTKVRGCRGCKGGSSV